MSDFYIKKLISAGEIQAAIALCNTVSPDDLSIYSLFTRKMFNNQYREQLPAFLFEKLSILPKRNLPIVVMNIVTLAEMSGNILYIRNGVKYLVNLKNDLVFKSLLIKEEAVFKNYFNCLLRSFLFKEAIDLLKLKTTHNGNIDGMLVIQKFSSVLNILDLDLDSFSESVTGIVSGVPIKKNKNTLIFRIPSHIWNNFDTVNSYNINNLPYPLNIVKSVKEGLNIDISLAPQYSMPGPSLYYPYQKNERIFIIDQHKYSRPNERFLHLKTTHKSRYFLVDRGGYSGWLEFCNSDVLKNLETVDAWVASKLFNEFKLNWLPEINRNEVLKKYNKFILIALQIPADSVQKLSNFKIIEMLELSIEKFKDTNFNIVITRHPNCSDIEISNYLENIKKKNVFIASEPTNVLIQVCTFVILCNSSVGWDAILAKKPIISFGKSEYSQITYQIEYISDLDCIDFLDLNLFIEYYERFFFYFWTYIAINRKKIKNKIIKEVNSIYKL
ncbi:capsular polysaccharide export protein, LipB/KpsS family [Psychrobacter sp. AOP30-A2-5]|uniref:capsular polysaccharide export protein, LipB/KpsS family n=1 Tax=Psychrobacter sp. AOP30-A2-5 TaxID=3457697 RepID=UPI00403567FE